MSKKLGIVSFSMAPEMHELLKADAEKKDISASKLVRDLVEKHLSISVDENVIPVILKIPKELRGKPDELRSWLDMKTNAIVKALSIA